MRHMQVWTMNSVFWHDASHFVSRSHFKVSKYLQCWHDFALKQLIIHRSLPRNDSTILILAVCPLNAYFLSHIILDSWCTAGAICQTYAGIMKSRQMWCVPIVCDITGAPPRFMSLCPPSLIPIHFYYSSCRLRLLAELDQIGRLTHRWDLLAA